MNTIVSAVELFSKGFNCAQAAFTPIAEELGMDRSIALKITTPFGGGILGEQGLCGAVSGAYLAIGLKFGRYMPHDEPSREITYEFCKKFNAEFIAIFGTLNCRELLGCDLKTEIGKQEFNEKNLRETKCTHCVAKSVEILQKIIEG